MDSKWLFWIIWNIVYFDMVIFEYNVIKLEYINQVIQASDISFIKFSCTDINFFLSDWALLTSNYSLSLIGSPIETLDLSSPTGN